MIDRVKDGDKNIVIRIALLVPKEPAIMIIDYVIGVETASYKNYPSSLICLQLDFNSVKI